MKQQVNPVVMIVLVVVAIIVLVFFGMKSLNPPADVEVKAPAATDKPAEINGHAVPNGVPYDYMKKQANQGSGPGAGGNNPYGYAPSQMPQHP